MRSNLQLYHTIMRQLCQWLPEERVTRRRNLALLVVGVYMSANVHMSKIVRKWPVVGKLPSLVNRLRRFLDNKYVSPRKYYEPLAKTLLFALAKNGLHLAIDTTRIGLNYRALVVGLTYRRRSLPLVWSLHKGKTGNTKVTEQIALLEWLYRLIPVGTKVCLTGDSAFRTGDLLIWLQDHKWDYVICQRKEVTIRHEDETWHEIGEIPLQPGETKSVGRRWIAKTNPFQSWLTLHWEEGEEVPWILLASRPETRWAIKTYRRRMWIEEMFGDMKKHGFDMQATHLRDEERIERLLLGVCITYVWLIAMGSWVVKNGKRHFVDRKDRRDKSYFRLGLDWIDRCFSLGQPVKLRFVPYL